MKLSLVPWMAFKAQDELTYEWRQYQKLQDGDHVDHRCHSTHIQRLRLRHLNMSLRQLCSALKTLNSKKSVTRSPFELSWVALCECE